MHDFCVGKIQYIWSYNLLCASTRKRSIRDEILVHDIIFQGLNISLLYYHVQSPIFFFSKTNIDNNSL